MGIQHPRSEATHEQDVKLLSLVGFEPQAHLLYRLSCKDFVGREIISPKYFPYITEHVIAVTEDVIAAFYVWI